jgi:cell shape-determining protein MreD
LKEPQISYTSLLLAVLVGILHAAASPVIVVGDAHPNLILIGVVLVTALRGFGAGVMWAFVGGLTANLLTREPLGSIPLALLLASAGTAGGERLFGRLSWVYPVAAVVIGSLAVDLIGLGVMQLVDPPLGSGLPIARIITAALLNGTLAAIVLAPARLLAVGGTGEERQAW